MPEPQKITRHECKTCRGFLVGKRIASGDVPWWVKCRAPACAGIMSPVATAQSALPSIEWYRPPAEEIAALPRFTRWAVEDGLLLSRLLSPSGKA